MNQRKLYNLIGFGALLVVSLIGAAWLANSIGSRNQEVQLVKEADRKVIYKLKAIRTAQVAYVKAKSKYCADWDTLKDFLRNGKFYNVAEENRQENINGKDTLYVIYDTISVVPVFDSIQSELGFASKKDIDNLEIVPVSNDTFLMVKDELSNGAQLLQVIDPNPVNPRRKEDGDLKPLKIGSLEVSTLQGSWE